MQAVLKNEDERSISRRANSVDIVIYIGGISRYLEEEYIRRPKGEIIGI